MTKKYTSTGVQKIEQITNKEIFSGSLRARDILKIVKFTQRGSLTGDPYSSLSERTHNPEEHYYQRIMSSDRVYAIKLFLLQQIYYQYHFEKKLITPLAIFPSSIILSCQLFPEEIERDEYINLVENDEVKDYCWVTDGEIIIPTSKQLLIVDGQHRVAGLESLIRDIDVGSLEIKIKDYKEPYIKDMPPIFFIKEILNRFSFIVTFLVDYDYYEQGTIFATVNFTQKSVDKSFYYDIFGSIQTGRTLEKLLHDLTAHLNYNIDSPLKDRIKMLGKGKGNFSQAFFIEAILPHFKKGFLNPIYLNYINDGEHYTKLPTFFKAYFRAFFKAFETVLNDPKSILLKTTGMGAIIQLMPFILYQLNRVTSQNFFEIDEKEVEKRIIDILNPITNKAEYYFGSEGQFSKGGSKGLQSRLFKVMVNDLGLETKLPTNFVESDHSTLI